MLYKLQSIQIPEHWEAIKFSAIKADEIKEEDVPGYCVNLLLDLLNGKTQCIMSLDVQHIMQRILLVSVVIDQVTQEKKLILKTIFSFVKSPPAVWFEETDGVFKWAKKIGCTRVELTTPNKAIEKLANTYGMSETSKSFSKIL